MTDIRDQLPPDAVMRAMSKLAIETVTEDIARQADAFAESGIVKGISGPDALRAFARSIRSTNAKQFPKGRAQS